ncbi:tRNA (guanosine(46)-N7)-methyltransferase TrmB [Luteipulveratus flavus]|uniref:tRNA (guanine-N(7)-)-methyltransferase n=1 Tax=Luteipulveratus flavus TaxID=3031728 RepID=A0ABT6C476_9MICO|nr:tRNA (guanosine(46)-N7)-methyltransferase TrmB [Luteipulveratus sp. YIM 133296]MDF8263353.1 tRNA (guanosine(46)-N7)-methyltransferase TrmB [Luteipulveratus sp. YIM 133296]
MQPPPDVPPEHRARTRSFTRRGGRMPQRHHRAIAEHGSTYLLDVELEGLGTTVAADSRLDLPSVFGRVAPVVVEIGSGSGDAVVHAAQQSPERDFVALEVWRPGVAQTIAKAVHAGVENIRLLEADAAQALAVLFGPGTVSEVWTFFPDPWPKSKHHKRRLVTPQFAAAVATVLVPGGVWRLATDWADYAWQMRDVVEGEPAFENPYVGRLAAPGDEHNDPAGARGGFAPRFEGRVETRFEGKGLKVERIVRDLTVVKR